MTTPIGLNGLVMYGPQARKGVAVKETDWHAHPMIETDFAFGDDVRTLPPEVGGSPMPKGAYKGGYSVGGSINMNPRLENSLGWLLYSLMGQRAAPQKAIVYEGILLKRKLTVAEQDLTVTDLVGGGTLPVGHGKLAVRVYKADTSSWNGTVTVTGASAETEDFNFSTVGSGQRSEGFDTNPATGAVGYETIVGAVSFTSATGVTLPAYANANSDPVYISVGYEDVAGVSHEFVVDSADKAKVLWLGLRKYIPRTEDGVGLGESFKDLKMINTALNLTNDGPLTFRSDILGCDFSMEESPAWATNPVIEDYTSVPISTVIGGYLNIPAFSSDPLPIVGATAAWVNAPLDDRQEREYGKPYRPDITISQRRMTLQLAVKYTNPDLYRACLGNNKAAVKWSPAPFMSRVDTLAISPANMPGSNLPFGLRVQVQSALLSLRAGIPLTGTDAVILRIMASAIDTGGKYASWTLTNLQSDYTWPS